MSKMYVWFLQKSKANHAKGPSKLATAISKLLTCTNLENDLIVAPGFLSVKQRTVQNFFDEFDGLLQPSLEKHVDVSFLRGMGSYTSFRSHVDLHKRELAKSSHVMTSGASFDLSRARQDHRKMVFLYSSNEQSTEDFNPNETSSELTKQEALNLAGKIRVNAVAIGSSNFSNATYFGSFRKGEADVILLANNIANPASDFSDIVKSFRTASDTNDGSNVSDPESPFAGSVFSESLFCDGDPHRFLNEILVATIEQML